MDIIKVENLHKEFKCPIIESGLRGAAKSLFSRKYKTCVAVDDISFNIKQGEIVGYLGPNGSGKSTTIKMITGILTPTSGRCLVNDIVPYKNRIENAKKIGVVFGQRTQLWWDLPLSETFLLLKKIYMINESDFKERLKLLREILDLDSFMTNTVRTLSLGQRMRADLAAALIHNPSIIYLDEPTIGLDVVVKDRIRETIKSFRDKYGTTIMLTTHDVGDIEELCSRILVIDKGKLIYDGSLERLSQLYSNKKSIEFLLKDTQKINEDQIKEIGKSNNISIKLFLHKIVVSYDPSNVNLMTIINAITSVYEVKDINIINTSTTDIIKKIYTSSK